MAIAIVGIYLKLNIVLFMAFLTWSGIRKAAQILNFSLSSNKELAIARIFFLLSLAIPVLFSIFTALLVANPDIPGMTIIGQTISSGIDSGLESRLSLAGQDITILWLVISLLSIGIAGQCHSSYKKYRQLKLTLSNSISWKHINGVSVMFSQEVSTPFSTKILGINQIILPYHLLESTRNFRLAVKHELQHIRNGDLHWVLLLDLIKPAFFWNPAFYAWLNEFHCLQEYACDEALVNKPDVNATAYGHCLLEVASHSFDKPLFASSNMVPNFALFRTTQSQLKRRIIMMTQEKNQKFQAAKITIYSTFLVIVLAGCSSSMIEAKDEIVEMLPIATLAPKYPNLALTEGKEGWALLEFTVNTEGNVVNPVIIGSCSNNETRPERQAWSERNTEKDIEKSNGCADDDLFDAVSLTAIEKFKFEPRLVNGKPIDVPGVRYMFTYSLQQ